jgi:AcrR family transcriptional regulator
MGRSAAKAPKAPLVSPKSDTPAPKPVRKRDSERTRAALMKAALKEFALHGFAGARIDRIADAAKCNMRMLYHYFSSKEGLYIAVLEAAYADLRRKEAALKIDVDQPLAGMLELMRFTFLYFQNNPLFEGLLRAENIMQGRFVRRSRPVPEGAFPLKKMIGDMIANGQRAGQFREDLDLVHVYVSMTALSRFHLANAYSMSSVLGVDLQDKAWLEQRLDHCLEIFRAYLVREHQPSPSPPDVQRAPRLV